MVIVRDAGEERLIDLILRDGNLVQGHSGEGLEVWYCLNRFTANTGYRHGNVCGCRRQNCWHNGLCRGHHLDVPGEVEKAVFVSPDMFCMSYLPLGKVHTLGPLWGQ